MSLNSHILDDNVFSEYRTNFCKIGKSKVIINHDPNTYVNLIFLAMDQIRKDNPDKDIHFNINNIDLQIESEIERRYFPDGLDKEDIERTNKLVAIYSALMHADKNTKFSIIDGDIATIIEQFMESAYNNFDDEIDCEYVFDIDGDFKSEFRLDQAPIYIADDSRIDTTIRNPIPIDDDDEYDVYYYIDGDPQYVSICDGINLDDDSKKYVIHYPDKS